MAERAALLAGRDDEFTMLVTIGYTGMRWGELTGLAQSNCKTSDGYLLIDPDVGALH